MLLVGWLVTWVDWLLIVWWGRRVWLMVVRLILMVPSIVDVMAVVLMRPRIVPPVILRYPETFWMEVVVALLGTRL